MKQILMVSISILLSFAQTNEETAKQIVSKLKFENFKKNIIELSQFGDREQGSDGNKNSFDWVEKKLENAGYKVERHEFKYFLFFSRYNIYVTKIGRVNPDSMYIVSAHLDGSGGGSATDDDASGSSLVLEAALAIAHDSIEVDKSIRFVFWNNEETGADGSYHYVTDRAPYMNVQGVENPPGSGLYPEPVWLGIIQHDMILYDHGLPPQKNQIPEADLDIEYQAESVFAEKSKALAKILLNGNKSFSKTYPAEIGDNMKNTDSWRFENYTAAISIRENQRIAEIGNGSNPHYHQESDRPSSYSEADYRLGFNALQMTLGSVLKLAGVHYRFHKK